MKLNDGSNHSPHHPDDPHCALQPLYISMVGRLIYEFGASEGWETEIIAMMQEDRGAVLGSGSNGTALGSKVVGGALSQIKDTETRELFNALAVAAEDVPVPMAALELIWCSHKAVRPPLAKIERMWLRKRAFELLDLNLLLGESTTGIFMHDVVRDYARSLLSPVELLQSQRKFVRLLVDTAPEDGWDPTKTDEKLQLFVAKSLRPLMLEMCAEHPSKF